MIENGVRHCDRCGVKLNKRNNTCGYELCDSCNETLESEAKNDQRVCNQDSKG